MTLDMNKIIVQVGLLIFVVGSWVWAAPKPLVLVTLSDMAMVVEAVGGDLVGTQVVVPPGADPHAFAVSAEQLRSFQQAALIVYAHSRYHEFEHVIKAALPGKPSLDWADYAAHGARLHDAPGYPQNPHGPWLYLTNASAIARAVAERLAQMGLPREALQARLGQFEVELQAQQRLSLQLAQERELAARPMLAVIPGVCDVIANFGIPVGDVLMAEGSGTVAGKRLQEALSELRTGQYSAIVCPLSMRQAKQGEAARQIARDSGAPLIYVHFLDAVPGADTYLSLAAYNLAAVASVGAQRPAGPAVTHADARRTVTTLLTGLAGLLAGIILGRRLARSRPSTRGAGIFDT